VKFFHSNILSSLRSKLPLFLFIKKKVHGFSFVPFKGFSPWKFKEERILIYSADFLFTGNSLKFYIVKKNEDELRLQVEIIKKGVLFASHFFGIPIIRRNYEINIIITRSILQLSMHKGKIIETIHFNIEDSFSIGLVYGPDLGFRGDFIIKMEYR
jgi:hypothetical protein